MVDRAIAFSSRRSQTAQPRRVDRRLNRDGRLTPDRLSRAGARRRDRGVPFSRQASLAMLVATDAAMRVTTDAV